MLTLPDEESLKKELEELFSIIRFLLLDKADGIMTKQDAKRLTIVYEAYYTPWFSLYAKIVIYELSVGSKKCPS
jgi:hypothetical protein